MENYYKKIENTDTLFILINVIDLYIKKRQLQRGQKVRYGMNDLWRSFWYFPFSFLIFIIFRLHSIFYRCQPILQTSHRATVPQQEWETRERERFFQRGKHKINPRRVIASYDFIPTTLSEFSIRDLDSSFQRVGLLYLEKKKKTHSLNPFMLLRTESVSVSIESVPNYLSFDF